MDEFFPSRIVKTVTTETNGVKIEKGYNKAGNLIKESIFKDYNNDGNFTTDELYSVMYSDGSMTPDSQKYVDKNNDGYYDEIVNDNPIFGKEVITEETLQELDKATYHGKEARRIDLIYGSKDSDGPIAIN